MLWTRCWIFRSLHQLPKVENPNVPATREAVFNAMAGHIRGKGTYAGIFHRPQ